MPVVILSFKDFFRNGNNFDEGHRTENEIENCCSS
jgi:hypothetical protein